MKNTEFEYNSFRFYIVNDINKLFGSFKLRHDVYVEQYGFEKLYESTESLEIDEFDKHAMHIVCVNKLNMIVGTIRLIKYSIDKLPILNECDVDLSFLVKDISNLCEISRFAIDKNYTYSVIKDQSITYGLFYMLAICHDITNMHDCVFLTDRSIYRFLTFIGIQCLQVGNSIEFRGKRTPYYINMVSASKILKQLVQ